jgi:hypothetical protein
MTPTSEIATMSSVLRKRLPSDRRISAVFLRLERRRQLPTTAVIIYNLILVTLAGGRPLTSF